MKNQSGFTLIELMIVVAIIAILAAIAIPAYNGYITEANLTRVSTAYEEGINFVRSEMSRRQSVVARGGTFETDTTAEWITALNNSGGTAPSGDPAFAANADNDNGVIGVSGNGTTASPVVLTRPNYNPAGDGTGLATETATITVNGAITYDPVRTGS